jgi:glucoamylase
MISDFGVTGNGELLVKVRADGALTEAFFPSIGFFRHIVQSQFGVRNRATGQTLWLSAADFHTEQRYLDGTNVLQTTFTRDGLHAKVIDFVPDSPSVAVRILEIENTGAAGVELDLFHTEASSVADHKGEFGYNVAYYNRLANHVVRYRGHPWDKAVEAQVTLLIGGSPEPDTYQCGFAYREGGDAEDAFVDVRDGLLRENRYAAGEPSGVTTALLWRRALPAGALASVAVIIAPGMSLFDAEDTLEQARRSRPEQMMGETVSFWRNWIDIGRKTLPDVPDPRLQRLYTRSLLLLKLLQDRKFGSFIAAPTLEPDYRYCWPRDAVYFAWALDRAGYTGEARHFYRWCRRTQMSDGLWYQNHYTDGRRHWTGIQVDQVAGVLWGLWQHYHLTPDRAFLVEMWPTVRRAAEYLLTRTDPEIGLVYSEQDLWEETGGYLTYTNAASVAGLECAARAAHELGHEREHARWRHAAARLRAEIDHQLIQGGVYVGEKSAEHRYPMRADYRLDVSNLGLVVPFRVVPPDKPEMKATVRALEAEMKYDIGGVGRYASDLFVGGNPWSLSGIWLALYFAEAGNLAEVRRQLDWCLKHAMLHDFMPEQSDKHSGAPASAAPLGWSHAWFVILLQRMATLTEEEPFRG